jgi:preprotein translocase subunit SecA
MVGWILKKILGSKNQRELKRLMPIVRRVNEFDEQFKSLSDGDLRAKTAAWKEGAVPEMKINGKSWMRFCRKRLRW